MTMACSESCKTKLKNFVAVGCGKLIGSALGLAFVYVPIYVCVRLMCDADKADCPELEETSQELNLTSAEEIELKECEEEQSSKVLLHNYAVTYCIY